MKIIKSMILKLMIISIITITFYYSMQPSQSSTLSFEEHKIIINHDGIEFKKIMPFFKKLERDNFTSKVEKTPSNFIIRNCITKQSYTINGSGFKTFYFKSRKPINRNYYPDFIVSVFTFASNAEAEKYAEIIRKSSRVYNLSSDQFECGWDKLPQKVISNGHFVFYLTTRAEMFRTYIDKYANILNKLPM